MSNPFNKLLKSLKKENPIIVVVTAINSDGTSTVNDGGRVFKVYGTSYAVGTNVFVKDGLFVGKAPFSSIVDVTV